MLACWAGPGLACSATGSHAVHSSQAYAQQAGQTVALEALVSAQCKSMCRTYRACALKPPAIPAGLVEDTNMSSAECDDKNGKPPMRCAGPAHLCSMGSIACKADTFTTGVRHHNMNQSPRSTMALIQMSGVDVPLSIAPPAMLSGALPVPLCRLHGQPAVQTQHVGSMHHVYAQQASSGLQSLHWNKHRLT
jgi:hypothetical protein